MTQAASAEQIARALGQSTVTPQGYKCRCPAHEDTKASMQINLRGNGDGRPTVFCHAGCQPRAIFMAIEAATGLHFEAREKPSNRTQDKTPSIYPAPIDWSPVHFRRMPPTKWWFYYNNDNQLMFVVARYDLHDGKEIRPFSVQMRNGQPSWQQGLGGLHPLPLYNLKEVLDRPDAPILVVEGEKACDAVQNYPELAEFVPVAYQGGAKTWKKADWEPVKGRRIYLWPDHDTAGVDQFYDLAKILNIDQFCEEVKLAIIPDEFPDKWDLADPLPDGMNIVQVSWIDAPKGGIDDILSGINPVNYMESFDAIYWLMYDGNRRYTVSKQNWVHSIGRPFNVDGAGTQVLNHNHPAWRSCHIGSTPAIMSWSDEKLRTGDFVYGFRFRPGEDMIIEDRNQRFINIFTGFGLRPDQKGDCTILKNYLLNVVCDGNQNSYQYLWNYLAHMLQFPGQKPSSALILKGEQGAGKTLFFHLIQALLGGIYGYARKAQTIDAATGRFNSFMDGALFFWIEELELTRSRTRENRLKSMITDDTIQIERKGKDTYNEINVARIGGATNHEHIWNVTARERRLSLFEVSSGEIDNRDYFIALTRAIKDTVTLKRLMYELTTHTVDRNLIFTSMISKAKSKQALMTPQPNRDLAFALLRAGEISLRVLDERRDVLTAYNISHDQWEDTGAFLPSQLTGEIISKAVAGGKYSESFYSARDERVTVSNMARMMGCPTKDDGTLKYRTVVVHHRGGQRQESGYILPTLTECRLAFCEFNKVDYADVFDDNKVIPFRRKEASSDVPF